jgi:tellurite methyltransferase
MSDYYNDKYRNPDLYWGTQPSSIARIFLDRFPPAEGQTLLEIGCGEGRDAVFFARNGFRVTGFDASREGIEKAAQRAADLSLSIRLFEGDVNQYKLQESYDVVFGSGSLHYIPQELRNEVISNYKQFTNPGGINVFMVPICKPFVPRNPEDDPLEQDWISGEILTHYYDWKIEYFSEEIQDDIFSDYQFTVNRLIAREPSNLSEQYSHI